MNDKKVKVKEIKDPKRYQKPQLKKYKALKKIAAYWIGITEI